MMTSAGGIRFEDVEKLTQLMDRRTGQEVEDAASTKV